MLLNSLKMHFHWTGGKWDDISRFVTQNLKSESEFGWIYTINKVILIAWRDFFFEKVGIVLKLKLLSKFHWISIDYP